MKWLKRIFITLLLLVGIFVIVGFLLPTDYAIGRSVTIKASPAQVHEYVGDIEKWPQWSPWEEADPSIKVTPGDITTGVGASQSWIGDSGGGRLTFTYSDPDNGIKYDLYFDGDPEKNISAMTYTPTAEGTQVTWSMQGKIGMPVIGGYFAMMMDSLAGEMFASGLNKLKQVVENP